METSSFIRVNGASIGINSICNDSNSSFAFNVMSGATIIPRTNSLLSLKQSTYLFNCFIFHFNPPILNPDRSKHFCRAYADNACPAERSALL